MPQCEESHTFTICLASHAKIIDVEVLVKDDDGWMKDD